MIETPRPFTPEMVAERWGVSANHVRNLIKSGKLRAFRLGERLLRIPAAAVEEFERGENQAAPAAGASSQHPGIADGGPFVLKLAPSAYRRPERKRPTK